MLKQINEPQIQLKLWADSDLDLLQRTNEPEMTTFLGGSESEEKILARHKLYVELADTGKGRMFSVRLLPELEPIGIVGYWERIWQDQTVYEIGWSILPSFQQKGLATAAATAAIARAREEQKYRYIHAFPSVNHAASNAICRKIDFTFIGECYFEYPLGNFKKCNDWHFDLYQ